MSATPSLPEAEAEVDPMLVEFLRTRGGKCPRCEYELHGLQDGRCPECGCAPRLMVARTDSELHHYLIGLVCLSATAGFYDGASIFMLIWLSWEDWQPIGFWDIAFLATALLSTGVLCLWLLFRRRICALPRGRRRLAAGAAGAFAVVCFASLVVLSLV